MGGSNDLYGYCLNDPVNFIDRNGLLAAPLHFMMTYMGARALGMGMGESAKLAWGAVAVDFGTQGYQAAQTNIHAMAGLGVGGRMQSYYQAIEATENLINDPCSGADKRTRIHAAQDLATPAHAGQPWTGFHFDMNTANHIAGDWFPTRSTLSEAVDNTLTVLQNIQNGVY